MNGASMNPNPKTILEMSGRAWANARLSDSVLLIIDAQREYVDGALVLDGIEEALAEGGTLLARARAAKTPVVHVLHRGGPGLFDPQGSGFLPAEPLVPQAGEAIVEKTFANAFAGTTLHDILHATGRTQLIVIGFMTHNCVYATVSTAVTLGYTCTVVAAATATRALPDGRGGIIPAAVLQEACLIGLSDTLAKIARRQDEIL